MHGLNEKGMQGNCAQLRQMLPEGAAAVAVCQRVPQSNAQPGHHQRIHGIGSGSTSHAACQLIKGCNAADCCMVVLPQCGAWLLMIVCGHA